MSTSVWWSCGNPGVELRYTMCNVGCSTCLFFCLFYNPILVGVVAQHTRQASNGDFEKAWVILRGVNLGGPGLGSHYAHMLATSDFVPVLSIGSH